ncbi:hypothetical protein COW83_01925, partial [Candidatus Collierbacteria bacterium CG22_combo_CG10-13_8_21_14_all_43_12]
MFLPNQAELLQLFSSFLSEAGLSSVSIKNYLCDLRHFLKNYYSTPSLSPYTHRARPYRDSNPSRPGLEGPEVTVKDIFQNLNRFLEPYVKAQQSAFTPKSTTNRRMASIRRFATFLSVKFDVQQNVFTQQTISNNNIRNRVFGHSTNFSESDQTTSPLTSNTLTVSSLRGGTPTRPAGTRRGKSHSTPALSSTKILEQFKSSLEKEKKTHSTIKNYLSDLNHFFLWTANQTPFTTQNLFNILSEIQLQAYITYLKLSHTSTSVLNRRQSSIKKLARFCFSEGYIPRNPFEIKPPVQKLAPLAWIERLARKPKKPESGSKNRFAIWYDQYNALSWTPYLNIALLVLATTAMAIFAYNQIIGQARPSAAATALTPPKRQLSFQGRLTDSSGTPITTAVSVVFKLFNALTGPTQLYTTGTCSITPDQEGIFSSLIGDTVCGAEIPSSVFTDNRDIFLEITVGAETLTPRQQIATVGYALNSETLQGYPASASAVENTIPVMNNDGDIILGSASPDIKSTSGNFNIEGQSVSVKTTTSSGGSIVLQPDAIGGVGNVQVITANATGNQFRVEDVNLTSGNLISGYVGNGTATGRLLSLSSDYGSSNLDKFYVAVDGRTKVNATSASGWPALTVNQTSTGNLFSASASGVAKFTLNNAGIISLLDGVAHTLDDVGGNLTLTSNSSTISLNDNVTFAGTTTLNSLAYTWPSSQTINYVLQTDGSGTLSWVAQSSGGSSNWRITGGALSPINDTLDLLVGSTASASAKFAILNVNSGTPTATISGSTAGAALSLTGDGTIATTLNRSLALNPGGGNVGVGTTNPSQKLSVEGQCIEENSLVSTSVGEKKIKDIQSGDQVLSLNEATRQFEYQIVEKTLDMGTKEIYELTTETGKRIETTANHPYLARTLGRLGRTLAFKETESNINQGSGNQNQGESNQSSNINIPNINHNFFFERFFNLKAINKLNIPANISPVKTKELNGGFNPKKLGTINAAPIQPADKLTNKSETTDDQAGLIDINNTLPQWTKVIYLNKGDEIATLDGFEKITSIKILPAKHVYDLQIANTHNFVANGIVAHNTYINSTATTASIKGLEIAQSGAITGTGYGLYATKTGASTTNVGGYFSASGATNNYGLIVGAGNVGIGT